MFSMSIPVNKTCDPECIGDMVCRPEVTNSSEGLPKSSCIKSCRKDFVVYEGEQCACKLLCTEYLLRDDSHPLLALSPDIS